MLHSFNAAEAAAYGILEAVLLHHLRFWIQKNEAEGRHFYNGKTWTRLACKDLADAFPYASKRQIGNALQKLRAAGAVEIGHFNRNGYDRTNWYALADPGARDPSDDTKPCNGRSETVPSISPNGEMESTKRCNGKHQTVSPIPDSNTDSNTDTDTDTDTDHRANGRFCPPTPAQVRRYCSEIGCRIDPDRFVDYYEATGWRIGNAPMRSWRAAVRAWDKRDRPARAAPRDPTLDDVF